MPDTLARVARTPLYHWHRAHGARFVDRDGWQVVAAYTGGEGEAAAARAGLGVADVSAFAAGRADVTTDRASFELVGPDLDAALRRLTHLDVRADALPPGSRAETALAGVEALLVRGDRGGLPALRIYVAWDLGEYVWERILAAGGDRPVTPLGLEALALLG